MKTQYFTVGRCPGYIPLPSKRLDVNDGPTILCDDLPKTLEFFQAEVDFDGYVRRYESSMPFLKQLVVADLIGVSGFVSFAQDNRESLRHLTLYPSRYDFGTKQLMDHVSLDELRVLCQSWTRLEYLDIRCPTLAQLQVMRDNLHQHNRNIKELRIRSSNETSFKDVLDLLPNPTHYLWLTSYEQPMDDVTAEFLVSTFISIGMKNMSIILRHDKQEVDLEQVLDSHQEIIEYEYSSGCRDIWRSSSRT